MLGRLPPQRSPLSALNNRQTLSFGKIATSGGSTKTSSVIGVCMNATLKSAVAAKSAGVPACTLRSVPPRKLHHKSASHCVTFPSVTPPC